jgi:hypothetical protein
MRILPHIPVLNETQINHFFNKVNKTLDGCWLWTGAINASGYGGVNINSKYYVAHRVSYEYLLGPVPEGLFLDHLCRVRNCVNPEHLEPVTHKENALRGMSPFAKNARKTHCPKGHRYDEINTRLTSRGRSCKACALLDVNGQPKYHTKTKKICCPKGHLYTDTTTYFYKNKKGKVARICKICKYNYNVRYAKSNPIAS